MITVQNNINRSAPSMVQMFPFPPLLWASSNSNAIFTWVCLHGHTPWRSTSMLQVSIQGLLTILKLWPQPYIHL